jgi:hypothetical protein
MGRKSASGSGIRDEQPGSYFLEPRNNFYGFFGVKILKFFDNIVLQTRKYLISAQFNGQVHTG